MSHFAISTPVSLWASAGFLLILVVTLLTVARGGNSDDPRRYEGLASKREVAKAAGPRNLLRRANQLRPSLISPKEPGTKAWMVRTALPGRSRPAVGELGHCVGSANGVGCFVSWEDSTVVLGPPRSGKGVHLVINAILGATGACVTTSTRPDNLTTTFRARQQVGNVMVFDPQGMATGIPSTARWSPIRGCRSPQTAMIRARALTTNVSAGTTDSTFWLSQAERAVRGLLHAAALGNRTTRELYRWSLSTDQAKEAVDILDTHPDAVRDWVVELRSIVNADARQRDSVWAMVGIAFASMGDPKVMDAVSPRTWCSRCGAQPDGEGFGVSCTETLVDDGFDPETFLREKGTLYLLGTSTGASATSNLVSAFIEDLVETAKRMAASSPGGSRLDPPLAIILDEAANYPLPSISSLMSDGGGTGITMMVVLQSLAQARAVWGEHDAAAIWDAAIIKIILGGGSNARDLDDLSTLCGQVEKVEYSESRGHDRSRSRTSSKRMVPVITPGQIRLLPPGLAILLLRSARPIVLTMKPWMKRPDAAALSSSRAELEALIGRAAAGLEPAQSTAWGSHD